MISATITNALPRHRVRTGSVSNGLLPTVTPAFALHSQIQWDCGFTGAQHLQLIPLQAFRLSSCILMGVRVSIRKAAA